MKRDICQVKIYHFNSKYLSQILSHSSCEIPPLSYFSSNLFYYDFNTNEWKKIEHRIKELQKEIDMLNKYIVKE